MLGKIPTTSVSRLSSLFNLSIGLVLPVFAQWASGKSANAVRSTLASPNKHPGDRGVRGFVSPRPRVSSGPLGGVVTKLRGPHGIDAVRAHGWGSAHGWAVTVHTVGVAGFPGGPPPGLVSFAFVPVGLGLGGFRALLGPWHVCCECCAGGGSDEGPFVGE